MDKEVVGRNLLAILQSLFSGIHVPDQLVGHIQKTPIGSVRTGHFKYICRTWIPILLNMNPVKLKYMTNILIICPFALK